MRCRFRSWFFTFILLCTATLGWLLGLTWNSVVHREPQVCSCSRCLPGGSSCFRELLDEAPSRFLSRQHPISQEEFNWWQYIQGEKRNFTFYNLTVNKVFEMFPTFPTLQGRRPERCRSCAVVGNSGSLRGSHHGARIDLHNIVIRINRGRTEGYEEDVGTKTTHRVMYPESRTQLDSNTYLLFFPFKTTDFLWLLDHFQPEASGKLKSKRIADKDLVMILSPAFMKYVHEAWLGSRRSYSSTGFMALVLSMFFCDEVSVFGFGADRDGNWDHYFEKLSDKGLRTGGHPGSYEYAVIEKLHKKEIVQFFKAQ